MTPDRETLATWFDDSLTWDTFRDWSGLDFADALLAGPLAPAPPSDGEAKQCHNGHPFVPGRDVDEPGVEDSRWCNVCGEARRRAPDGEADEAAGRVAAYLTARAHFGDRLTNYLSTVYMNDANDAHYSLTVSDLRLVLADRDRMQRALAGAAAHVADLLADRDLWRDRAYRAFRLAMEPEEA